MNILILTMILELDSIEGLFSYVRQRQCQYGIENSSKTAPVRTLQPTSVSRFPASPGLRSGRPSGIPVKTTSNSCLRQVKVTQLKQQEGTRGTAAKSLNYMVVSLIYHLLFYILYSVEREVSSVWL
jgi:hypothetical protein